MPSPPPPTEFSPLATTLNVRLSKEEMTLAVALARVIAQPGRILNVQDVLRIALAQIGLKHQLALARDEDARVRANPNHG